MIKFVLHFGKGKTTVMENRQLRVRSKWGVTTKKWHEGS